jgi:hypothetical protein
MIISFHRPSWITIRSLTLAVLNVSLSLSERIAWLTIEVVQIFCLDEIEAGIGEPLE